MNKSSIPSFKDFVGMVRAHFEKRLGEAQSSQDFRNIIIVSKTGEPVTLSLDKLYRFYVDVAVTHPERKPDELMNDLESFVDNYRANIKEKPLFSVKAATVPHTIILEQCCIR